MNFPDIDFFHTLADAASRETMPRYRTQLNIDTKPKDGFSFDPVTDADREAEKAIRALINQHYPDHAILGEEFGLTGTGDIKWILDPVDGTRPFICGIPVWATLIGLIHQGKAVMGMMSQPFTQERFWADGKQAWMDGPQGKYRLKTKQNVRLSQAILHTTGPELFSRNPQVKFNKLNEQVLMTRYGGESYAMAMLAAGHIDLCLELSLQPYDIVALIAIIEQAGGVVTTLDGKRAESGGKILASANSILHQQALDILNG